MDAVIYAARSKDEDPGKDSTGDQIAAIRAGIAQEGGRTIIGEPYVDHASGYTSDRGADLEAAIAAAVAASPSELWVAHSSRLGRGTGKKGEARAIGKLLYDLMAEDVTVRSVADDQFTTNEMLWGITSTQSSKYSKDLSAHTRRGKKAARQQRRWPGGPVPDGYRLGTPYVVGSKTCRDLEEDPERALIIRRAFDLRLDGLSFGEIARTLNSEGHRTLPQPKRGIMDGLPFTGVRVRDLLSNPIYAGRLVDRSGKEPVVVVDGTWQPIVDPKTFDLVGVKMKLRRQQTPKGGRTTTAFALAGLAVCAKCDRPMFGQKSGFVRKDGTRQRFYRCAGVPPGTCNAPRFDGARVDDAVIAYLGDRFIDFDAWAEEQARAADQRRASIEAELAGRRKALAKLQRQRDTARERYLEKQTPAREDALEHVLQRVTTATREVDEIEGRLTIEAAAPPTTDAMLEIYSALLRKLQDDKAPVNERLKRVFEKFRIELVVDKGREMIAILPVLRLDAIDADEPELMQILDGDNRRLLQVTSDERASPVMILVPPPIKGVRVPLTETGSHAWA